MHDENEQHIFILQYDIGDIFFNHRERVARKAYIKFKHSISWFCYNDVICLSETENLQKWQNIENKDGNIG